MTPLEKDIERALVDMIKRHGGLCLKWVCPSFAGVPDRIVLLPGARVLFVELKRPRGGKIAPLQKWWAKQLSRLGFLHFYVCSWVDIKALELIIQAEEAAL